MTASTMPGMGDGSIGPLVAMGHYRHGLLLAPVTADAIVALLFDDLDPDLVKLLLPFDPNRFDPHRFVPVAADATSAPDILGPTSMLGSSSVHQRTGRGLGDHREVSA